MEESKELLEKLTTLAGSEELAKQLLADGRVIVNQYAKEQSELLKGCLKNIKVKLNELLPSKDKDDLHNIISSSLIDSIIILLLEHSVEAAIIIKTPMSKFIYDAAHIFEQSAVRITIESMKSSMMDMLLNAAAESRPDIPKEKMS